MNASFILIAEFVPRPLQVWWSQLSLDIRHKGAFSAHRQSYAVMSLLFKRVQMIMVHKDTPQIPKRQATGLQLSITEHSPVVECADRSCTGLPWAHTAERRTLIWHLPLHHRYSMHKEHVLRPPGLEDIKKRGKEDFLCYIPDPMNPYIILVTSHKNEQPGKSVHIDSTLQVHRPTELVLPAESWTAGKNVSIISRPCACSTVTVVTPSDKV